MSNPEFHVSSLMQAEICGESYRREQIERERKTNSYLLVGHGVHNGRDVNLSQKIKSKVNLSVDDVKDATRDCIIETFNDSEVMRLDDEIGMNKKAICNNAIDFATSMSEVDYEAQKTITPLHVEESIALEFPEWGFNLGMKIDTIEIDPLTDELSVTDLKTSRAKPAATIAQTSEQLALYSIGAEALTGKPIKTVNLDYIVKTKTKVTSYRFNATPNKENQQAILNRMNALHAVIQTGTFLPAPTTHWKCGEKYCQFYSTCKFVVRAR